MFSEEVQVQRPGARLVASTLRSLEAAPPKTSLHLDAVAELREMIISGELPPGERLREVALSERLGMSRTPLREAFRTLAGEGLVDLLPNRSVVVSEVAPSEAADVFVLFGSLESLAAQQACARMPEHQIDELGTLHGKIRHAFRRGDREAYTNMERGVHEMIVEGSQNAPLISAWRLILPRAQRAWRPNALDRKSWAELLEKLQRIYAALAARNDMLAGALVREYFATRPNSIHRHRATRPSTGHGGVLQRARR